MIFPNRITRRFKYRWLAAISLVVILLWNAGCGATQEPAGSTLEKIQRSGVVRVGYANEAPYAYLDQTTGRLTGEAVEIARAVFANMGVEEIKGEIAEFGSLIPGLKAKRFDMIAAGMYIKPERCQEIAFTNPTYKIGEAFMVPAGNPLNLNSYEDVASHPTARLGVVAGAVELGYARATGIPEDRIAVLPDAPSAVEAVLAGRIDAYAGTSLTIQNILNKTANKTGNKAGDRRLEKADPFTNPVIEGKPAIGYGAFGIRKEDRDLLKEFNAQLKEFIGSEEHLELVAPFGFTKDQLPGEVTAAELCGGS